MLIRFFKPNDEMGLLSLYQKDFAGFPWYESLSLEILKERFNKDHKRPGFDSLVAEESNQIVGACWWDSISLALLRKERGGELAAFCATNCGSKGIVWFRDTMVEPSCQGRGIATELKRTAFKYLRQAGANFIFTRFRDDNLPIIAVNQKFGMRHTGVDVTIEVRKEGNIEKIPGSYWFLDLKNLEI